MASALPCSPFSHVPALPPPTPTCAANTLHPGVVNTELARYLLPEQASCAALLAGCCMHFASGVRSGCAKQCSAALWPILTIAALLFVSLPKQTAWWQAPLLELSKAFALTPEQGAQVGSRLHMCCWRRM